MSQRKTITCPVDGCGWFYVEPEANECERNPNTLAAIFGVGVMSTIAANRRVEETEKQLSDHFKSHKVEDYLRTITNLSSQKLNLQAMIADLQERLEQQ